MNASSQHLAGLVLLACAACAPAMPQKINEVRNYDAAFVCDGAKLLRVQFTPFAAALQSDGVSANLTQQPVADGFLYTGGGQSLRARGNQAIWTDVKGAIHQCQDRAADVPKSDAPAG